MLSSKQLRSLKYQKRSFSFSPNCRDNVVVVGGGLMGSGIAQVCSEYHQVTLVDLNADSLAKSMSSIKGVCFLLIV
jgi:hypothetical protein